jgi:UDP:flavonoid glycosyltransferase YjiC (YdhE family)
MPFMFVASVPYFPAAASFSPSRKRAAGCLNRLPDRWLAYGFNKKKTKEMNDWRVRLGMQPFRGPCLKQLERQRVPVLHAYSPTLLPLPRESGEHHFISGAIGLDRSRHLSPVGMQPKLRDELKAWLDSGSAPIYFGVGSLPPHMTAKGVDMIVELTQQLQARAIVPSGLFEGDAIRMRESESIRLVDAADPLALFSRCSCVIHDGNADTTHAVIEAGKPAVICSVDWEQRLWGERIEEHRVGSHLARSKLTLPGLIKAIRKQLSDPAQKRAAELGVRLRSENGLQRGLEWVEQRLPIAPVYNND